MDDLFQPVADTDALRPDHDRLGVQAGEIEELLDELAQAADLHDERGLELLEPLRGKLVAALGDRLREPIDRPDR